MLTLKGSGRLVSHGITVKKGVMLHLYQCLESCCVVGLIRKAAPSNWSSFFIFPQW